MRLNRTDLFWYKKQLKHRIKFALGFRIGNRYKRDLKLMRALQLSIALAFVSIFKIVFW